MPAVIPKTGWAQSGNLKTMQGSRQAGTSTFISGNAVTAQSPAFEEAQVFTIQFGVIPPTYLGAAVFFDATAEISWSVNGNTIKRIVSVGDGVSISGAAQQVQVRVIDSTPVELPASSSGSQYTILILITPGTRAANRIPLLRALAPTFVSAGTGSPYVEGIATAGTGVWTIPKNAGISSVNVEFRLGNVPAAGPYQFYAIQRQGGVALKNWLPLYEQGFIPLAPGADDLLIGNDTGATTPVSILWGIDG